MKSIDKPANTKSETLSLRLRSWISLKRVIRGFGLTALLNLGVILGLLWLFAELIEDVFRNESASLDNNFGLWVHSFDDPFLDNIFLFFTTLGNGVIILSLTAVTFGLMLWRKHFRSAWIMVLGVGGGVLINQALKFFFQRPRPQLWADLLEKPDSFSFPSGHATLSFCYFGLLVWLGFKFLKLRIGLFIWTALMILCIALVGLSRIYFGVHYLTDVVGGYICGSLWLTLLLSSNAVQKVLNQPTLLSSAKEGRGNSLFFCSPDYPRVNPSATKLLLINPAAGKARRQTQLETLLHAAGQHSDLAIHYIQPEENLDRLVQQAVQQGIKVIGVAGGDGTVNSVASALIDRHIPLVVVPFGTLNHFARDIGISMQPQAALRLFDESHSQTRAIDVGEVNGRYFLNNSSVGLYASLVRQRERYEHGQGLGKWPAYAVAGWHLLRRPKGMDIIELAIAGDGKMLDNGGKEPVLRAGLVFVSNNLADMFPLRAGHRPDLRGQILEVYVVKATSLFQLFRVTVSFLRNKLSRSPFVRKVEVREVVVYTRHQRVQVACDGEVYQLSSPLYYRVQPARLVVRVPVDPAGLGRKARS